MPDGEGSLSYINASLVTLYAFVCLKKCDKFKLPPSPADCAFKSVCVCVVILVKCHCDRSPRRDAAKPHGLLPFIFIGAAAMA